MAEEITVRDNDEFEQIIANHDIRGARALVETILKNLKCRKFNNRVQTPLNDDGTGGEFTDEAHTALRVGLIAEEVAEIEPRFATYGPKDGCACPPEEDDPHHVEHHLEGCLIPEGVQYDRIVPHLINLAKRQDATIKELGTRVALLEA